MSAEESIAASPAGVASRLALFPVTTRLEQVQGEARLTVGGCDLVELAERWGTPLYVYDRASMDAAAGEYWRSLRNSYPGESGITYAGKAFLSTAVVRWAQQHGLQVDCTGAGELAVAAAAGLPRQNVVVHGVSKSAEDLEAALALAGVLVIDHLSELERVISLMPSAQHMPQVWLRLRPGMAVETHAYTQTGQEASKFGMSAEEFRQAVRRGLEAGLPITGLHFHQGSHFHDPAPLAPAIERALELAAELRRTLDWRMQVICPGGGWGVAYHEDQLPHPSISDYVQFVTQRLLSGLQEHDLGLPRLQLEPGRSLVAQAGVAIYRVQGEKESGGRRWVLVDGGMADNPRPALYGARYSALPASDPLRLPAGEAALGGPYCESGDVLIESLPLPRLEAGELVAVPVSGAYQVSMASNYNGARRPAVLMVFEGQAQLIQRRETLQDLLRRDVGILAE